MACVSLRSLGAAAAPYGDCRNTSPRLRVGLASNRAGALAGFRLGEVRRSDWKLDWVLKIECKESRIGKVPVEVPQGVEVFLQGQTLVVKGPLGELRQQYPREVKVERDETTRKILVSRALDTRRARQMHGLFRTLTDNVIVGVFKGFEKRLQLIGVGYRAAVDGGILALNLGFSHQVRLPIPSGITAKVEENTRLIISGRDKCAVGDFSAAIRSWRPPEPYKGKGIKYADEIIRRKEGKVGKKK